MLKINVPRLVAFLLLHLPGASLVFLSCPAPAQNRPSGSPSAQKREMTAFQPDATFNLGGDPDWMAVAEDAVWVSTSSLNRVTELKAPTNTVGFSVAVNDPCSGLVAAFGSLWIPSCGDHSLLRANLETGEVEAMIAAAAADSEGCIAAGAGSIWLATDKKGTLARIDPRSNSVRATILVPSGSYCPVFADEFIWVTSFEHSVLSKVDPGTNRVVAQIRVGKNPRFATSGAGAVWSLNQGDGTVSRVDTRTSKVVATIKAGLAGHGGEITFGFGSVWVTLIGIPVTRIDAATNSLLRQWQGDGGDSIRAGLGTVWLTHIKAGLVWRISPEKL
jgi:virginiamycin B lyase